MTNTLRVALAGLPAEAEGLIEQIQSAVAGHPDEQRMIFGCATMLSGLATMRDHGAVDENTVTGATRAVLALLPDAVKSQRDWWTPAQAVVRRILQVEAV